MSEQVTTRRERQHQATMDEIVSTARDQLSQPGGLSLRAIAQAMGITAPALYRYVSSLDDLTLIVAASIYDELLSIMEEAAQRYAQYGPGAQIIAGSIAYRQWAIRHRDEFVLCFVNEVTDPDDPEQNVCAIAGDRFRRFFAKLFVEIYQQNPFPAPADADLGETARAVAASDKLNPLSDHLPGSEVAIPIGAHWVFLQVWTRLFGNVALEVFGHIGRPLVESGDLFRAVLVDCGEMIGIEPADVPGYDLLVAAELAR